MYKTSLKCIVNYCCQTKFITGILLKVQFDAEFVFDYSYTYMKNVKHYLSYLSMCYGLIRFLRLRYKRI